MDPDQFKQQKAEAIRDAFINLAQQVKSIIKDLPLDKHARNIFLKKYNRRPMRRQKKAAAFFHIRIAHRMTQAQVAAIVSQPRPKFPPGGGRAIISNHDRSEIIHRSSGDYTTTVNMNVHPRQYSEIKIFEASILPDGSYGLGFDIIK